MKMLLNSTCIIQYNTVSLHIPWVFFCFLYTFLSINLIIILLIKKFNIIGNFNNGFLYEQM